jgi:hypothetical protein
MATNALDVRIAHLEGAYEQIDKRLESVDGQLRDLRSDVRSLRTELVARMDRQFFWILGLLIISILSPLAGRVVGR